MKFTGRESRLRPSHSTKSRGKMAEANEGQGNRKMQMAEKEGMRENRKHKFPKHGKEDRRKIGKDLFI